MPKIIGLAGRAGSGKSTCGEWLARERGAVLFSLADPLKRLAQDVFGFTDAQVFGTQADKEAIDPRWGISPRHALIRLGNAARERLGLDVWLNACLKSIDESGARLAVITDIRYPNEAEAVHRKAGYVVLLRCPDSVSTVDPGAPSERSVDEIDMRYVSGVVNVPRSEGASLLLAAFKSTVGGWL